MSVRSVVVWMLFVLTATPALAHRLDEYLQATTIAIEKSRVRAEMRLVPGVEVFPTVFADIDRNADGVASETEQRAYAERVLGDLSLRVDDTPLRLRLLSWTFGPANLLREGRGEIQLEFQADVPIGAAAHRVTFENRHQRRIGVYLVNGLVSPDPEIRLGAQKRSEDQSVYEIDYADTRAAASALSSMTWPGPWGWIDVALMTFIIMLALAARRYARAGRVA